MMLGFAKLHCVVSCRGVNKGMQDTATCTCPRRRLYTCMGQLLNFRSTNTDGLELGVSAAISGRCLHDMRLNSLTCTAARSSCVPTRTSWNLGSSGSASSSAAASGRSSIDASSTSSLLIGSSSIGSASGLPALNLNLAGNACHKATHLHPRVRCIKSVCGT